MATKEEIARSQRLGNEELRRQEARARIGRAQLASQVGSTTRKAASSALIRGQSFLDSWNRFVAAYAFMMEDDKTQLVNGKTIISPSIPIVTDFKYPALTTANAKLLKTHWESEEARNYRFHNLKMMEPAGRAMYAAEVLGKRIMNVNDAKIIEQSIATASSAHPFFGLVASGANLTGKGVALMMRDKDSLNQIREAYNSPEALKWIEKNGDFMIDLPASMIVDMSNPVFMAIGGGAAAINRTRKVSLARDLANLKNRKQIMRWLIPNTEGGPASLEMADLVADLARKGKIDEAIVLMDQIGLRPKSAMSRVRDGLPQWFRQAGQPTSPQGRNIVMEQADRLRLYDQLWLEGLNEKKAMRDALGKLDSDGWLEWGRIVSDPQEMDRVIDGTIALTDMAPRPEVIAAAEQYISLVDLDFVRRASDWHTRLPTRLKKLDKLLRKNHLEFKGLPPGVLIDIDKAQESALVLQKQRNKLNELQGALKKNEVFEQAELVKIRNGREALKADVATTNKVFGAEIKAIKKGIPKKESNALRARSIKKRDSAIKRFKRQDKDLNNRRKKILETDKPKQMTVERGAIFKEIQEVTSDIKTRESTQSFGRIKRVIIQPPTSSTKPRSVTIDGIEIQAPDVPIFKKDTEVFVDTLTGKVIKLNPKIMREALTQAREMPPYMVHYTLKAADDLEKGNKSVAAFNTFKRAERYNQPRNKSYQELSDEDIISKFGTTKGRDEVNKHLEKIAMRAAGEVKESTYNQFVFRIETALKDIKSADAIDFGGPKAQAAAARQFDELLTYAKNAASPGGIYDPIEGSSTIRSFDVYMRAQKQVWLFGTPSFYIQNFMDNSVKNIIEMGPADFARWTANTTPILPDAPKLNFTRGLQNITGVAEGRTIKIAGQRIEGFLPKGSPQEKAVSFLVDSIESSTRNHLGTFVYHKKAEQLLQAAQQAGRPITRDIIHRASLDFAESTMNRVQFFNNDMSGFERWIERLAPFSVSFAKPNLLFWSDKAVKNPEVAGALLRLRDKFNETSQSADGSFTIKGTGIRWSPESFSSVHNAIQFAETVVDPANISAKDQAVSRTAAVFDSGLNAFTKGTPAHIQFVQDLVNGKFLALVTEPEDFDSLKDARDFLRSTKSILGPLNTYTQLALGKDLDQIQGEFTFFNEENYQSWLRWQDNYEKKVAAFNGETITSEEAVRRTMKRTRTKALGRLFGLDLTFDPNENYAEFESHRNEYLGAASTEERKTIFFSLLDKNDEPALRGTVPPFDSPGKYQKEWDRLNEEKDPIKKFEILRGYSEDVQRGLTDGIPSAFFGEQGIFSKVYEEFNKTNAPSVDEATQTALRTKNSTSFASKLISMAPERAAGISKAKLENNARGVYPAKITVSQVQTVKGKQKITPISASMFKQNSEGEYVAQIGPNQYRAIKPGSGAPMIITDVIPDATMLDQTSGQQVVADDVIVNRDSAMFRAIPGINTNYSDPFFVHADLLETPSTQQVQGVIPEAKKRAQQQQQIAARAYSHWRQQYNEIKRTGDPVLWDQWITGQKLLDQQSGESFDTSFFVNDITHNNVRKPRIAHFYDTFMIDEQSRRQFNKDFLGQEIKIALETKVPPLSVTKQREKMVRADKANLKEVIDMMRHASRYPDARDPLEVHETIIQESGNKLPFNTYKKLYDLDETVLIQEFSMAVAATGVPFVNEMIFPEGADGKRAFSESGLNFALAQGLQTEVQILSTANRKVRSELVERGITTDIEQFSAPVFTQFLENIGVDTKDPEEINKFGPLIGFNVPLGEGESPFAIEPGVQPPGFNVPEEGQPGAVPPKPVQIPKTSQFDGVDQASRFGLDPIPLNGFRNISDYVSKVISQTRLKNRQIRTLFQAKARKINPDVTEKQLQAAMLNAPQWNVPHVALRYLSGLDPAQAARGAQSVMSVLALTGAIGRDELRVINRGITQASAVDSTSRVAENVLALSGNAMAGMSSTQRLRVLGNLEKSGDISSFSVGLAKYGQPVGQLLSLAGGFALGADEEGLGQGLSVAGGAVQGAALGTSILPGPGTIIGGVVGGLFGALTSGVFEGDSDRDQEFRDIRAARDAEFARRAEEARARSDAASLSRNRRDLTIRPQPRAGFTTSDRLERLTRFFRRPTFASNQGLVIQVERQARRQFQPRF